MPALNALQGSHTNELVILGISLDSFQEGPLATSPEKQADPADQAAALRRIVGSLAARQRVAYPILLDPAGTVARRFEGNELPTQVLIDPAGRLVRRFVGGRSPDAWAALLRFALDGSAAISGKRGRKESGAPRRSGTCSPRRNPRVRARGSARPSVQAG